MGDLSAKSYHCSTCGAPLALEHTRHHILRCRYCGSDHRVLSAKAQEQAEIRSERRVGSIVAPYLLGPVLGFAGFFAMRDFLWSPYEGKPAIAVGFIFLVIGLMSFRIPAALGLALVGLAGVLKPFVRPIESWWSNELHYLSPTSESALAYLIPGLISAAIGFGFFSSLKVRDVGPALHALVPRISMVLATAIGIAGGYFYLGETGIELTRRYQPVVDELVSIAEAACEGTLPATLQPPLDPVPEFAPGKPGNVLMVSCQALAAPSRSDRDPLYLGQLHQLIAPDYARRTRAHAGADDWQQERYQRAAQARYVVAYREDSGHRQARVVDRTSRTSMDISDGPLRTDTLLYAALTRATGGHFPAGQGIGTLGTTRSSSTPEKAPPPPPPPAISATFQFQSSGINSIGTLWIYGFVTNTSSVATDKPEVLVILKDSNDRELRSEHAYAAYPLAPGQRGPIAIMISNPPDYTSLEYETIPRRLSGLSMAPGLVVANSNQSASGSTLNVSGKVRNDGAGPARFVQVHILQFGANDVLIGLRNVFAKAETLESGQEARFLANIPSFDGDSMRIEFAVSGSVGRR